MISEQKEAFLNSWFDADDGYHWSHGMANQVEQEVSERFDEAMRAYTRAVPDVPELVRYDKSDICLAIENGFDPLPSDDGEYVLHSQAAKILAALKVELHDMRQDRDRALEWRDYDKERAEAAEAKLAQYEAQEHEVVTDEDVRLKIGRIITGQAEEDELISFLERLIPPRPVYAPPAPAADLKAENEKIREALKLSLNEVSAHTLVGDRFLIDIVREAINPSEPRT